MPLQPNPGQGVVVAAEGAGQPEGLDEALGPFQQKATTLEINTVLLPQNPAASGVFET